MYPELDGPEFMGPGPVGPRYVQEGFDRLAALGANTVNVSHPGLFTETPPCALDGDVQANLDRLLALIAQANMFAVISFRAGPSSASAAWRTRATGTLRATSTTWCARTRPRATCRAA